MKVMKLKAMRRKGRRRNHDDWKHLMRDRPLRLPEEWVQEEDKWDHDKLDPCQATQAINRNKMDPLLPVVGPRQSPSRLGPRHLLPGLFLLSHLSLQLPVVWIHRQECKHHRCCTAKEHINSLSQLAPQVSDGLRLRPQLSDCPQFPAPGPHYHRLTHDQPPQSRNELPWLQQQCHQCQSSIIQQERGLNRRLPRDPNKSVAKLSMICQGHPRILQALGSCLLFHRA